jgi:hypothetical protein
MDLQQTELLEMAAVVQIMGRLTLLLLVREVLAL